MGELVVERVSPERTLPLRQVVLRPNLRLDEMNVFGDDGVETGTFGAVDRDTGEVVGTATVRQESPRPGLEGLVPAPYLARPWRVRGMATREDLRSKGIGRRVLDACIAHVAERGGGLLWCDARIGAVEFYERAGFVTWGGEFISQDVAHIVMWRLVEAGAREAGK